MEKKCHTENKINTSEKEEGGLEELENLEILHIEKVYTSKIEDLPEINLNQFYIKDSEFDSDCLSKINFSILLNSFPNRKNFAEPLEIFPNKMKSVNDFFFLTFCQIFKKNKKSEIAEFNLMIYEDVFGSNSTNNNSNQNKILLNSTSLEIKLDQITNFDKLAGYKFFSNFYVIPFNTSFIIFLVVFKFVLIIRIKKQEKLGDHDKGTQSELEYEILFKKEYTDSSLLLLVGSENFSKMFKFHVLFKPGHKIITFTCKFLKENCPQSSSVHIEEKNLDGYLENFFEQQITNSTRQLILSKITVSNSSEILFFEKSTKNIYLINKTNLNQIRAINDPTKEILNHKNFFALSNKSNEESNRIYLITDEIINENSMKISLWKIDPLNECESVNCEKLQSILIKTDNKEFELGDYSFILIDENYFSLYFQDFDKIYLFNVSVQSNTNEPVALIENIYEFAFDELFPYMLDYQMNLDGVLTITLYQEEELLRYKIDLKNFSRKVERRIRVEETFKFNNSTCENKIKHLSSENSSELSDEKKFNSFTKKSTTRYEDDNNLSLNPNTKSNSNSNEQEKSKNSSIKNNISVQNKDNDSCKENSSDKNLSNNLTTEKSNLSKKADKYQTSYEEPEQKNRNSYKSDENCRKIETFDKNLNTQSSKYSNPEVQIQNFSESIAGNFVNLIEDRIEKIFSNKINTFSDKINNQLVNVFSYMKSQSGELQQIRKNNEEAMNKLMEIIINVKSKNSDSNIAATNSKNLALSNSNKDSETKENKSKNNKGQLTKNEIENKALTNTTKLVNTITNINNPNNNLNGNINFNNNFNTQNKTINKGNSNINLQQINPQQALHMNKNLGMQQCFGYQNATSNLYNNSNVNNFPYQIESNLQQVPINQTNSNSNLNNISQHNHQLLLNAHNNLSKSLPLNNVKNSTNLSGNMQHNTSVNSAYYYNNLGINNINKNVNLNYPFGYYQTYGLTYPYYMANMNYTNCKPNEIPIDANKYKEDDIALENLEKNLCELNKEIGDYKLGAFDYNNENNKIMNYSSDSMNIFNRIKF